MLKLKAGTIREDGRVFRQYRKTENGIKECWVSPESWQRSLTYHKGYDDSKREGVFRFRSKSVSGYATGIEMSEDEKVIHRKSLRRAWLNANRERLRLYDKRSREKRREFKPSDLRRLAQNARVRIRQFLKGDNTSSIVHLGCSIPQLKLHLESQFVAGMSWENYGLYGWHVDHRIPLASAETLEELLPLFHYTNLQPLWALDNLIKGSRLV